MKKYFEQLCSLNGIGCTSQQLDLIDRYVQLLLQYNSKINLISRKDEEEIWRNHILHSVSILTRFNLKKGSRYFDLGTGGGLPGIPLAILHPESHFVLCDSIKKKVDAVEDMRQLLKLHNVETIAVRAEELHIESSIKKFDAVFARAITDLKTLCRYAHPLLSTRSEKILIAWKGGELTKEIQDARRIKSVSSIDQKLISLISEPYFEEQQKYFVFVHFRS